VNIRVPTAAERLGDFYSTVIASGPFAGTIPAIYDPTQPGQPQFIYNGKSNVIPPSSIASQAIALLTCSTPNCQPVSGCWH